MHSVLVVARAAKSSDPESHWNAWQDFQKFFSARAWLDSAVSVLSEGCLHILLESGLPDFAAFVNQCASSGLPYRILFFEEEPKWLPVIVKESPSAS